ncbi:MAG: hypothetical protein IT578_09920 [Verrucomicrobiae bacterium]|nr:hypothetical protein [Verrucomicrobiae bacterium]
MSESHTPDNCPIGPKVDALHQAYRRLDREMRPVRLVSLKNLALVVGLIGVPAATLTAFSARWWISQDFVLSRSYERDRGADAALDQAERLRVKESLDALKEEVRGAREDVRALAGLKRSEWTPLPFPAPAVASAQNPPPKEATP